MPAIENLTALEILDSRGRPTVRATCTLKGGVTAAAAVPSGASTGTAEALELRDGDKARYGGLGCKQAVANVAGPIASALQGKTFDTQAALDAMLLKLDGTPNKSRLGANAILAVSIAFARASAQAANVPLYAHFATMVGRKLTHLPRMTINLFSGGIHAGRQVSIQDVLMVPAGAKTIDQGLSDCYAVFQAAAKLVAEKYKQRLLRADEGGLAPPVLRAEELMVAAVDAIRAAGQTPGAQMALAVDVASTHFFSREGAGDAPPGGEYRFEPAPAPAFSGDGMIAALVEWTKKYPLVSIEDGLSEEHWTHWPKLRVALEKTPAKVLCLGDDFLCTNPVRIERAIREKACNALLLKVNQIGSLTEAARARQLAADAGWKVTVSTRSGETEDDWLADLAVGWGADQIKIGSITQSERLAKYNRLLAIEAETRLPVVAWPAGS